MLSRVQLFVTLWTVANQAPLSMGFSGQECWNGLPLPSPGEFFLTQGSNLSLLHCRQILYCPSHRGSFKIHMFKMCWIWYCFSISWWPCYYWELRAQAWERLAGFRSWFHLLARGLWIGHFHDKTGLVITASSHHFCDDWVDSPHQGLRVVVPSEYSGSVGSNYTLEMGFAIQMVPKGLALMRAAPILLIRGSKLQHQANTYQLQYDPVISLLGTCSVAQLWPTLCDPMAYIQTKL